MRSIAGDPGRGHAACNAREGPRRPLRSKPEHLRVTLGGSHCQETAIEPRTAGSGISHLSHSVFPMGSEQSGSPGRESLERGGPRRPSWVLAGVWAVLVLVLAGATLWPSSAHARGRRVVPNLQQQWNAPHASKAPVVTIGITVHVPEEDGMPLATQRQVAGWIERANMALRPHGVVLELRRTVSLTGFTAVTRPRERRRLASLAEHDGTIHVFVTESLDPRAASSRRRVRGLHWRYYGLNRELRQREYVMVTLSAPKTTFAHEVGHLLGLRHSNAEDNIMCSCRRGNDTGFTIEQGAVMLLGAGRFMSRQQQALARNELQRYRNLDRARRRR